MKDYTKLYIDGAWVAPLTGVSTMDVINPATEQPVGLISLGGIDDLDLAVSAARKAFRTFSRTTRAERLELLQSILGEYAKRQDDLADAMTEELGAPTKFSHEVQVGVGFLHLQTAIAVLQD